MLLKIGHWIVQLGLPLVAMYHMVTGSILLNTAAEDASGLEKIGNHFLVPCHYLLAGHKAALTEHGYRIEQRFTYKTHFWSKTAASFVAIPFTTGIGLMLKGLALLSEESRKRHAAMVLARDMPRITSNRDYYSELGIVLDGDEWMPDPQYTRHPDREGYMQQGTEALRNIAHALQKHGIPFWLDCGTALGAQRYGGVIPWDNDIDIAILEPDHFNVRQALKTLDQTKYMVQDWSSRSKPYTYLKVYARDENILIDIYHHRIDPERETIQYIISNYDSIFLPDVWRWREECTSIPEAFGAIFPLKKALFEGIEVFVPQQLVPYLQRRYGENISPPKIYNEETGEYEKDLSHPYWQLKHAH